MLEKFFSPRGRVTRLQNLGYELLVFVSMWVVGAVLSFAVFRYYVALAQNIKSA